MDGSTSRQRTERQTLVDELIASARRYLFCQRTVGATLRAAGMPLTPTTQFPALNNDELLFGPIRKHEISSALTRTSPGHLWPPSRFRMCGAGSRERRNASFPGQLQLDASSSSGSAMSLGKIGEVVTVTSIRATDVALDLGRVPAGFYAVVRHSGLEWRTENKRPSVNHDVVEWNGPISM
ncbi:hypothetical protein HD554DRAFT_1139054 [Boletus coccyginus]|nr:hypothetical protein HD554DRAFT_1139054 [Boletus coccyginus]